MSKSLKRVRQAAMDLKLAIEIVGMPESTRTAEEAARACGCAVGQIVKSLVFHGETSNTLKLFLVGGDRQLDLEVAAKVAGEKLRRAAPHTIREITGFAIGGVAPIGHLTPLETWMDPSLLDHAQVWAAAGTPHHVFAIAPDVLLKTTGAVLLDTVA